MYNYMIIYDVILHSKEAIFDSETVSMKGEALLDTVLVEKVYLFLHGIIYLLIISV